MPEVLRVIARMNLGGPARHVLRIEAGLRARGWCSHLVTGCVGPGEVDLTHEARDAGVSVTVVPELGRALHPTRDWRALQRLRALIAERRPELVHTHTAKAGTLGRLAVGLRGRAHRPLLVHTYHGHVLAGYFGAATSGMFRSVERQLARRSDALIAVATRVRDELLQQHGVGRAEQYHVIPPGIDPTRTAADARAGRSLRRQLNLPDDEPLAGWVGRHTAIKRVDALLDAWSARRSSRGALVLVGAGEQLDAVRERAASLRGVHVLPAQQQLGAVYGALDLFVLPSRSEGLPQAVVEARSAGLPVLASAVGGLPELVVHGRSGLLLPPDDMPAWAAALDELLGGDARRHALAAGSAADPLVGHSPDAVAAQLAALYDSLLARRLARRPTSREPALETIAAPGHAARSCTSRS
ncbi:MAG: glycosyl transferase [Planctomycetota bacterium]|nr:MAG: glycosyl transferase [Planctomycetota bacterium]